MKPEDRNLYRPAVLWGAVTGVVAFLVEYAGNDAALGRSLAWPLSTPSWWVCSSLDSSR